MLNKTFKVINVKRVIIFVDMNELINWLNAKMKENNLGNNELARRAGVSPATVSIVLSGQHQPSFDFCVGVARAFNVPPEKVLRLAGLLPSVQDADDPTLQEFMDIARALSPGNRRRLMEYALLEFRRQGDEQS